MSSKSFFIFLSLSFGLCQVTFDQDDYLFWR